MMKGVCVYKVDQDISVRAMQRVIQRQAIRRAAHDLKATITTYSMSQAMVSCAFVMRRSARADFASEYVSIVGLELYCWLRISAI
jgi:hypothetical protein